MDRNLALEVVRVTEAAALASARFMGRGDEAAADEAATEAMHQVFNGVAMNGTIVIGEGNESEVPMLFMGEKVGNEREPEIDVALDALEGPIICATGGPNAISVIAITERGKFLACPNHLYMEKIAVGPEGKNIVNLDKSPQENLKRLAEVKETHIDDLTVVILDRPRNEDIINEVRKAGARVRLFRAGDLAPALATTRDDTGVDILMGSGRAAQGILAAAALRCIGGEIQGRFMPLNREEEDQLRAVGIYDWKKKYTAEEMAGGNVMFAATGVTPGDYLKGVRFFKGGATTNSVVMRCQSRTVRFIKAIHHFDVKPEY
jgi:fructose-1,6-bisphosphatase class II